MWFHTVLSLLHPSKSPNFAGENCGSSDLESQDPRCSSVSSKGGEAQHPLSHYSNASSWDQILPADMSIAMLDTGLDLDSLPDVTCNSFSYSRTPGLPPTHGQPPQRRASQVNFLRASVSGLSDAQLSGDLGRAVSDATVEIRSNRPWSPVMTSAATAAIAPPQPHGLCPAPPAQHGFSGWGSAGKHAPPSSPMLSADVHPPTNAVALMFESLDMSSSDAPATRATGTSADGVWRGHQSRPAADSPAITIYPAAAPMALHRMQSTSAAAMPTRDGPPPAHARRMSEQHHVEKHFMVPGDLPVAHSPVLRGRSMSVFDAPLRPPVTPPCSPAAAWRQSSEVPASAPSLRPKAPVVWRQMSDVHVMRPTPSAVSAHLLDQAAMDEWDAAMPAVCVSRGATARRGSLVAEDICFEELQLSRLIGQGGFGHVHLATWRGLPVAVKLASLQAPDEQQLVCDFHREVHTMARIPPHPNVLRLIGSCVKMPRLALVTEYCGRGSLFDKLHGRRAPLSLQQMLSVCLDVARGMAHLHSCQVLHRDLKSANLLLDDSGDFGRVKICDFGLSRLVHNWAPLTGGLGTFQWMAPEVLTYQKYSDKADVYSFGIVMHELLTREVPYTGRTAMQAALAVVSMGLRPPVPLGAHPGFTALMTQCWAAVPDQRPSFGQIVQTLGSLMMESGCGQRA